MSLNLLDVRIDPINSTNFIEMVVSMLQKKPQLHIVTPNPEHLIHAQENPEFKKVLNEADLSIPDGIGIILGLQITDFRLKIINPLKKSEVRSQKSEENHLPPDSYNLKPIAYNLERFPGIDALQLLCQYANDKKWTVALVGGFGNTAQLSAQTLSRRYPDATFLAHPGHSNIRNSMESHVILEQDLAVSQVAAIGSRREKSTFDENQQILTFLNKFNPHILIVAYGAPYQELWINQNLKQLPSVKIAMGVGGAFDVISGRLKRPPLWIQNLGLEWLYRLTQEPWRWKRQLRLIQFGWKVLMEA